MHEDYIPVEYTVTFVTKTGAFVSEEFVVNKKDTVLDECVSLTNQICKYMRTNSKLAEVISIERIG